MKTFVISMTVLSVLKIGLVMGSQVAGGRLVTDEDAAKGCATILGNVAVATWGVYLLFFAR